jgi:hypothetical protein
MSSSKEKREGNDVPKEGPSSKEELVENDVLEVTFPQHPLKSLAVPN